MKRLALVLAFALVCVPAFAQQGATEIEHEGGSLLNRWIAAYNRGDVEALAADVYSEPDKPALASAFADLHAESFGRLEAYDASFCGLNSTAGRALLKFTRLYTFGGKMRDDEAKLFDIAKTDAGWRITGETDVVFSTVISCS